MSSFDRLRSFAEAREHGSVPIRDGISYADAREIVSELERLRELLRDAANSALDARYRNYVTVQMDPETWDALQVYRTAAQVPACQRCSGTGIVRDTDTNMGGPCPDCSADHSSGSQDAKA